MSILMLTNSGGGLYNFRKELIERLIENKYSVTVACPRDEYSGRLIRLGCELIDVQVDRRGTSAVSDIKQLIQYFYVCKRTQPKMILTYTIKPNIYGSIVARVLKIPYIVNITGLGSAIHNGGILSKIINLMYRVALRNAQKIFVQNREIKEYLITKRIANSEKISLIPGSGVNLEYFKLIDYPETELITCIYIGRLMIDKGTNELLDAVEHIKTKYKNIQFYIIGPRDNNYYGKLSEHIEKGMITYHGMQKDVRPFLEKAHVLIQPSHHEGLSNVLLEAAASGRPVIASKIPGCQETFDEGISGIGFQVKNTADLIRAIEDFIKLNYEEKEEMGLAGRKKVEKEFSREIVINAYMQEIEKMGVE